MGTVISSLEFDTTTIFAVLVTTLLGTLTAFQGPGCSLSSFWGSKSILDVHFRPLPLPQKPVYLKNAILPKELDTKREMQPIVLGHWLDYGGETTSVSP